MGRSKIRRSEILSEINFFTDKNIFHNVVCEMAEISSRPGCINNKQPHRIHVLCSKNLFDYFMIVACDYISFWKCNNTPTQPH